jgi:hypothetical protein
MKNPLCCTTLPKVIWWLSTITITPLLFFFMLQSLKETVVVLQGEKPVYLTKLAPQETDITLQVNVVDDTKKLAKRSDEFLFLLNGCIRGEFPLNLCKEIYHVKKENKKESSLNIIKSLLLKSNKD